MHTRRTVLGITLLACATTPALAQTRYEPNWESLDKRPVAPWFDEAKFGIFIHWGVFSVPAWGPRGQYAEWYWRRQAEQQKGADKGKGGPFWDFHKRVYGPDFKYQAFAPQFRAELFDPDAWADVFARSGARYVVLTSKHHDGYALWPSAQSPGWNAMDTGPKRDLAGDLSAAVKKKGVKFGFYYSLYEWYHPLWKADVKRYVGEHMLPQMKDLVTRYKPELLWTDGEWDHPSETFRSTEFLAWLFNEAPGGADIVINDRWGKETRSKHGGFFTTE
jgi:alpha-L-fucosidase